jgi:hypothetical protein
MATALEVITTSAVRAPVAFSVAYRWKICASLRGRVRSSMRAYFALNAAATGFISCSSALV